MSDLQELHTYLTKQVEEYGCFTNNSIQYLEEYRDVRYASDCDEVRLSDFDKKFGTGNLLVDDQGKKLDGRALFYLSRSGKVGFISTSQDIEGLNIESLHYVRVQLAVFTVGGKTYYISYPTETLSTDREKLTGKIRICPPPPAPRAVPTPD